MKDTLNLLEEIERTQHKLAILEQARQLLTIPDRPAPPARSHPRPRHGARKSPAAPPGPRKLLRHDGFGLDSQLREMIRSGKLNGQVTSHQVYALFPNAKPKRICDALCRMRQGGLLVRTGYGRYETAKTPKVDAKAPKSAKARSPAAAAPPSPPRFTVREMVYGVLGDLPEEFTLEDLKEAIAEQYADKRALWGELGAVADALRQVREAGDVALGGKMPDHLQVYKRTQPL